MSKANQILIIISLSIFFFSGCSKGINERKSVKRWGYKGKVKSAKITSYEGYDRYGTVIKGNCIDIPWYLLLNYYNSFNIDGYEIETTYFDTNNNIKSKTTYNYNFLGNLSKSQSYKSNSNLTSTTTYNYRYFGRTVIERDYDSDGELKNTETYKYNLNSKIASEIHSSITYHFVYNKKNQLIEKNQYINTPHKLKAKWVYEYNCNGKLINTNSYSIINDYPNGRDSYTYDNNEKLIESSSYSGNKLQSKWTYKRDIKGNITESNYFRGNRNDKKIVYMRYDWENNWTKSIMYEFLRDNKKNIYIVEREFEYYE